MVNIRSGESGKQTEEGISGLAYVEGRREDERKAEGKKGRR